MKNSDKLYYCSIRKFSNKKYISTALIQRKVKVSYIIANEILDRMVAEGYASPRIGLYPCTILSGRFKKIKSIQAQVLTHIDILLVNSVWALKVWRVKLSVKYFNRL